MQRVDVNAVLQGEGQGKNVPAETEDSSRRKEGTDYWVERQKARQQRGWKYRVI